MSDKLLQQGIEEVVEWVLLLSSAAAGLCGLALVVMMVVGRWRLAVQQSKENRRRSARQQTAKA
jgi:hypothetical protein